MVPENIQTPTTEGIRNSRGLGWGGQRPRKFQRGEGLDDSKLNLVSLQDAGGYSLLSFQNSEFLFFSLFCLNFVVESVTCSAFLCERLYAHEDE